MSTWQHTYVDGCCAGSGHTSQMLCLRAANADEDDHVCLFTGFWLRELKLAHRNSSSGSVKALPEK